jgi:hypothetical protein
MKKEVVEYECDNNCGNTGVPDPDADRHHKNPLPKWWGHVVASTDGGMIFEMDLCGDCMKALGDGLHARRQE